MVKRMTHFLYFHFHLISKQIFSFLFIWSVCSSKTYSRKDTSPNYNEFSKNQTRIGRFARSQNPTRKIFIMNPAFNYSRKMSWDNSKRYIKPFLEKKKEKQIRQSEILLFTMLRTLDSFLYWNSLLTRSQLWIRILPTATKCRAATYNRRQVCVTIKKNNVNKPPFIQIRLFTAQENVNYTLNIFKKLSQILGDFMYVENCIEQ